MPTSNNLVKMKYCTLSRFQAITPDDDTIYFITDKRRIYLGSVMYGGVPDIYSYSSAFSSSSQGSSITYTVSSVRDSGGQSATPIQGDIIIDTQGVIAQVTVYSIVTGTAQIIGKLSTTSSSTITINEGNISVS